ncbi:protein INVOLVED IN DE NOVO 2 isoform X2 [Sorghum bicolor]|uniref:Factor of DNA methylation 1-5/IDN2 domain-containing protein n=4 Tax=Sorghum bicolor TaxID=4558 RepID=C5Z0G9_SORBI|nr:protein INVOLVED IN DE NOVO 2 isoform X2 [Sorghum bicolor]EES19046.2 hypothetical protein SORBI_3009G048300 [Sorghum bicolor]OQU77427.1 hypothetical protein SORBI_3009G048300 [Sorghum bicolor]|eukprot:XP_021302952.1 protein INVOLVED IN DE NOVO 2 isoform X2 [Sorghum bicolor]
MDYTSDGDSEVEAYGSGTFELLESGDLQVMTDEGLYRCPFCSDEDKDHSLNDLLQHASGVGAAHDRQAKEKADHRALARHLKGKPAESPGARLQPMLIDVQDPEHTQDEQFVWPWMAILVNMPNEFFGKSANRLKEHYSSFHPVKVHPVYSKGRPTRDAVFEFGNDWSAFRNARAFDAHFAMKGYSKNCWKEMKSECKEPVGWMARADDYNSLGAIGELLRKNGDLKTLKDIGSEGANKTEKLLSNLACKVKEKEIYLEQLESEYNKRSASLNIMMQKREQQLQSYNQEILKMRQLGQQNTQRIVEQNRKLRYDMQDMADALDARNKQIEQSEHDKKKLEQEKLKNAMRTNHLRLAALEQEKADENVQKLVDKQTRETKAILDDFLRLNTQLEKKQKLELEINHLSGKLHVMELKPGDEDPESREKIDKLKEELNEKIDELKYAENYNQDLISRERKSSDELREAREVLINSLQSLPRTTSCQSQIGVKKVGELDPSVFLSLCKRKFPAADAEAKSSSLCSKWQNEIENPEWQPFKVIIVDGKASEALNEGDRKLQELKELGQEPYAAVTKVLMELKDANGGRKDPFPELWNYDQGRKANMVEGARHAVMLWNASKTKKGKKSR